MTSPYLNTPTRSLEQLRDELRYLVKANRHIYVLHGRQADFRTMLKNKNRLIAVEAEIAAHARKPF